MSWRKGKKTKKSLNENYKVFKEITGYEYLKPITDEQLSELESNREIINKLDSKGIINLLFDKRKILNKKSKMSNNASKLVRKMDMEVFEKIMSGAPKVPTKKSTAIKSTATSAKRTNQTTSAKRTSQTRSRKNFNTSINHTENEIRNLPNSIQVEVIKNGKKVKKDVTIGPLKKHEITFLYIYNILNNFNNHRKLFDEKHKNIIYKLIDLLEVRQFHHFAKNKTQMEQTDQKMHDECMVPLNKYMESIVSKSVGKGKNKKSSKQKGKKSKGSKKVRKLKKKKRVRV